MITKIFSVGVTILLTGATSAQTTENTAWQPADARLEVTVPTNWTQSPRQRGYTILWHTDDPAVDCGMIDYPGQSFTNSDGSYNVGRIQSALAKTLAKPNSTTLATTYLMSRPATTGHTTAATIDPFNGPFQTFHTFIAYSENQNSIIEICSTTRQLDATDAYPLTDHFSATLTSTLLFRDK